MLKAFLRCDRRTQHINSQSRPALFTSYY